MKQKSNPLTFRLPDELRGKLEKEANVQGRSLSNLIVKILSDYIKSKPL